MNDELEKTAKELADAHWSYIHDLLSAHGIGSGLTDICRFHYVSAFVHGFKHGIEQAQGIAMMNEFYPEKSKDEVWIGKLQLLEMINESSDPAT